MNLFIEIPKTPAYCAQVANAASVNELLKDVAAAPAGVSLDALVDNVASLRAMVIACCTVGLLDVRSTKQGHTVHPSDELKDMARSIAHAVAH